MVRHYGNKHLGPVRFQLISAAVKTAITRLQSTNRETGIRDTATVTTVQSSNTLPNQQEATVAGKILHSQAYINAACPRPFQFKPNWGSVESVQSDNEDKEGELCTRVRANSWDSTTSADSYISAQ